ncbi:MAG: bifunctional phosphoribosylaminoimidazolecarboxamide formyltransferase/IMP cyclohydrolase [Candidatus Ancaeobacter aquaticus]|nr:bifunctional phosphoribosylaminoimidazolecarboxamide formyltransferase/IMP cyclohydrolase [Candidatus Ancaeobacter aquaticus]
MKTIQRALISVSDKKGIVEFATGLRELKIEIISTGGTAKTLKEAGLPVVNVSDFTGYPEMLDGRVKTLHPKVHGGILAKRDNPKHLKEIQDHGIQPIDMVVINLYPFEETIAKPNVTFEEIIENIDIGGPTMLRSAAKNYKDVAVIVNPSKYKVILDELKRNKCGLSDECKFRLAVETFQVSARYDAVIYDYLGNMLPSARKEFPPILTLTFKKSQDLRYGENPHQKGAYYKEIGCKEPCISNAVQHHGKELSYNNIFDTDATCELIKEFDQPAAVIIKHGNPCGAACAQTILEAYQKARETDPISAFGGIIGFNRNVTLPVAQEIVKDFKEVVVAPSFDEDAEALLKEKKNLRLMTIENIDKWAPLKNKTYFGRELKKVVGGLLMQERDTEMYREDDLKVVTERKPTDEELKTLLFAWTNVKHVKSNAIVLARGSETVGVGAGQMSRVDSVRIAIQKANKEVKGSVLASDAFFPFRDSIDAIAAEGIIAVIQPGGSVKDEEVIAACNEHNIAMVFTGMRHFKH